MARPKSNPVTPVVDPLYRVIEALTKQIETGATTKDILEGFLSSYNMMMKSNTVDDLNKWRADIERRVDAIQNMVVVKQSIRPQYQPPSLGQ
jgi:high-affinity Fe2+/Pb2+ permease